MPVVKVNGISCVLAARVKETTQTTGTGTYSLDGAVTGFRTFVSGIGTTNTTVYTAVLGSNFESGIGLITTGAPATLSRSQILESSNGGNAVDWGIGIKDIWCDMAAAVAASLQDQIDTVPVAAIKQTVRTTTGTFTTDAKCLFALVRIVGGGGAGGGTDETTTGHSEGGGGGGGEYAEGWFTAAQLGASKSVTIGAGGIGVVNGTGGTGGTTNFGSGLLTAVGGSGGGRHPQTTSSAEGNGGIGGTGGAGGGFRVPGGRGHRGIVREGKWQGNTRGGSSLLSGHAGAGVGQAGQNYGSGGNGAINATNTAADSGNNGAAGVCIVTEFLHR